MAAFETQMCRDHIENMTDGKPPYLLLFYLNPGQSDVWQPLTTQWRRIYIAYTSIFSLLFFAVGIFSIVIAIKKNCHRLKAKTFIAIYTCLAIFGISRGIFFAADPFGIIGWLMNYIPFWTIISRSFKILGFPSFSAAYMMVFMTLYKSTSITSSRHWNQDWRIITVIVLTNYLIAIAFEAIANIAPYSALLSIVICNAAFSLWGLITCIIFLFAGSRLLYKLKHQQVKTMRMSASFDDKGRRQRQKAKALSSEDILYNENFRKHFLKIAKTFRKIILITIFSAITGILYALLNLAALFFMSMLIFGDCLGLYNQGDPILWLSLEITMSTIEIPLVIVMLYSVTDLTGMMKVMFCCKFRSNKQTQSTGETSLTDDSRRTTMSTMICQKSRISLDFSSPSPVVTMIDCHHVNNPQSIVYPPVPNYPPPKPPTTANHTIIDTTHSSKSLRDFV